MTHKKPRPVDRMIARALFMNLALRAMEDLGVFPNTPPRNPTPPSLTAEQIGFRARVLGAHKKACLNPRCRGCFKA